MNVICPGCRESYHETTDKYNPKRFANGSMLRLKNPWRDEYQWSTFFENDSVGYGELDCPGCGAPYAPSGYLTLEGDGSPAKPPTNLHELNQAKIEAEYEYEIVEEGGRKKFECQHCKLLFATKNAFKNHNAAKHKKL